MQETRKTATENIRLLFIDGDKPLKLAHLFSSLRPHSYHFPWAAQPTKKNLLSRPLFLCCVDVHPQPLDSIESQYLIDRANSGTTADGNIKAGKNPTNHLADTLHTDLIIELM